MKKTIKWFVLTMIFVMSIIGFASAADMVITGVIDGPLSGGIPKAIEVYVINDIADLSAYGLGSANNGGGTDGEEFTFPAVSATAGSYIYVASESVGFTSFFGFAPDYTDAAANINGDDAIELFQSGSVIDVFGDINVDGTGQSWDHLDGWAYRVDATGADGSTFVLANWSFSGTNALDGETTNATATTPFPIGTYIFKSNPLIITGVIDGPLSGGIPKAVELYVNENIADLSIYGLGSANNGGGTDGDEFTFPAVSATAGDFIYVASEATGFTSFFGFAPDYTSGAASINGDDAIELFQNGIVIDVFGDISVDGTGEPWEYLDGWAYRVNATGADGSTFILANWLFSGKNALDGETTNAAAVTPFPNGTYSNGSSSSSPSITNITQSPTDVNSSTTVSISAEVTDDGTLTNVELHWGTTSGSLSNTIAMSLTAGSTYTTDTNIPVQAHGTTVFFEIEAIDNDSETSTSSEQSYYVSDFDLEPTNHVTNFIVTKVGAHEIILSWHENDGADAPSGYLIKASTADNITEPVDGTPVINNTTIGSNSGAVNLDDGRINYEWMALDPNTTYYFKIYPYSNSGVNIDYKTSVTVPNGFNTTTIAAFPVTYYASTSGLTGAALKAELNDIISSHTPYPYTGGGTDTWDILKLTDKDPNHLNPNNVILLYKGSSVDAAQEYNSGAGWTREHVWPQSHGDFDAYDNIGPGTDVHHLRPCDMSVNSSRSNLDFDNGGVQHVEATGCYYDSDSWEPRNAVKGDIARMVFYMATRYEGEGGDLDLELTETIPSSPNKEPLLAKLLTLYQWHIADPVDAYEIKRNEIIYSFQGNRNPFIDNPSYVDLIWNEDGSLPVELSEFTGNYSNGVVELTWRTESEVNNLGFNVYRSENNNANFQKINASLIEGAGNSTTANDYSFTDTEIIPGTIYQYKIEDVANNGVKEMHGAITIIIEEESKLTANSFELGNAYPNPFNPTTSISYTLPKNSFVTIKVYDNSGNLVDELVSNHQDQGYHTVTWDATNQPSGIYFYKLTTNGFRNVKKCLLVK